MSQGEDFQKDKMSHETKSHRDKTSQEQTVQEENDMFWRSNIAKRGGGCICRFMAQQLNNRKARELGGIVSPGIEPGYIVFPSHKNNVKILLAYYY